MRVVIRGAARSPTPGASDVFDGSLGGLGDFGTYPRSLALRDDLLTKVPEPYMLERDLRHFVGAIDQSHTAPAAGSRWKEILPFLFPATAKPPACYDGIDNDGDGLIDYPSDPGCASSTSTKESPEFDADGII